MKKHTRKWVSIIAIISIYLSIVSPVTVFAESAGTQNETTFLDISSLPDNLRFLLGDTISELSTDGKTRNVDSYSQDNSNQLQVLNTVDLNSIQVEDGNGNGRAIVLGVPIRYTDDDGNVRFIDTSMTETDLLNSIFTSYDYQNTSGDTLFQFSKKPEKGIRVDKSFTYAIYNADKRKLSKGYVDQTIDCNGRMVYPEAFGKDTYVEYINTNTGVKENIVLETNISQNRFEFVFESKEYIPILSEDQTVIYVVHRDNPEDVKYCFSSLYVYDSFQPQDYDTIEAQPSQVPVYVGSAAGTPQSSTVDQSAVQEIKHFTADNYYEVAQLSKGKYKITSVVSAEFLNDPNTVYPVTIDPGISSVSRDNNAEDTFVWENDPNNAGNGSLDYLRFGMKNGGRIHAYHRFTQLPQLGSNPYYVNITDATLKFTFRSGQTSGADGVCMMVMDEQWSESTLTWSNQPYGEWGYVSSHNNYQYYNFYIRPFVEMWYYGGYPNYGVDFTYDTMVADYNSVVSSEGEVARAPQLSITYSVVPSATYDVSVSGTLELGDYHWYKITPSYSGVHVFYSQGSVDMYGELFQGATRLTANDDGGDGFNFRISYSLTAGTTYYLKVRGYDFEATGYYQTKILPDYTTPLNALLVDAVELCKENRCMSWTEYYSWCLKSFLIPDPNTHLSLTISSFLWFYRQVKPGAMWDVKIEEIWSAEIPDAPYIGQQTKFLFRGYEISAEDMGNIMYGYTGRAVGFGKTTLFWGGGVAKQKSINNDAVNTGPYYGDDPNDHENIDFGYDLFESDYPDYPDVGFDDIPVEQGWVAAVLDMVLQDDL